MQNPISEFKDNYRVAKVFPRYNEYRVACYDSYFDVVDEFFCKHLEQAENKAEDWVLNK